MRFTEMINAVDDAENTLGLADAAAVKCARLMVGRLRRVNTYNGCQALKALKKELKGFNSVTGEWKP